MTEETPATESKESSEQPIVPMVLVHNSVYVPHEETYRKATERTLAEWLNYAGISGKVNLEFTEYGHYGKVFVGAEYQCLSTINIFVYHVDLPKHCLMRFVTLKNYTSGYADKNSMLGELVYPESICVPDMAIVDEDEPNHKLTPTFRSISLNDKNYAHNIAYIDSIPVIFGETIMRIGAWAAYNKCIADLTAQYEKDIKAASSVIHKSFLEPYVDTTFDPVNVSLFTRSLNTFTVTFANEFLANKFIEEMRKYMDEHTCGHVLFKSPDFDDPSLRGLKFDTQCLFDQGAFDQFVKDTESTLSKLYPDSLIQDEHDGTVTSLKECGERLASISRVLRLVPVPPYPTK